MMRWFTNLTGIAMLLCAIGCATAPHETATLVLKNAHVVTMDETVPDAQAIAVKGNRIVFVGNNDDVIRWIGLQTKVEDLRGAWVYPGLVDAHCHVMGLGMALENVDLVGTSSYEDVIRLVKERAAKTPKGQWILGRGWDQNDWETKNFPTHEQLSRGIPDHPVWLTRVDGHAGLANATAMELAGITPDTADPDGGRIVRDASGTPTGVFVDNGELLIQQAIPEPGPEQRRDRLERAMDACRRLGLTGVHDAGITPLVIRDYQALAAAGKLGLRVYAMLEAPEASVDAVAYMRENRVDPGDDNLLTVRSLKMYADGALGSRGAALLEPYSDDPGNTGLLVTPADRMAQLARAAVEADFQICTHAIGDRANRLVLDAYQEALQGHDNLDHRFRIEHAQILSPEDIPRFHELGVIPSMQPTHATSDMPWAGDRLGENRLQGAYAWRSLLDTGTIIPCGSDFPVESPNPMLGIYAAITRQDLDGHPEGGWYPNQRMSRLEALKGFTSWAAIAAFEEGELGVIRTGMLADLTVMDADLLTCPPDRIPEATALLTIVNGRILFRNPVER